MLAELEVLDASLTAQRRELASLRNRVEQAHQDVTATERRRHDLLDRLRRHSEQLRRADTTVTPAAPASPVAPPRTQVPPVSPAPQPPAPQPTAAPPPAGHPTPRPPRAEASRLSMQNALLAIGGIVSAIAIIIFTAVSWNSVGLLGRAVLLSGITVVALAVPVWLLRRKLTATAETLAALGLLMVGCDGVAIYLLDVIPGLRSVWFGTAFGFIVLLVSLVALVYRFATAMVIPAWAALGFAALALPVMWIQPRPVVAGIGFAITAALALTAAVGLPRVPGRWGRQSDATLPHLAAGIAVFAIAAGTGKVSIHSVPDHALLISAVTVSALLVAAGILPKTWRLGSMIAAGVGCLAAGMMVTLLAGFAVLSSLESARPIWAAAEAADESWLWPVIPAMLALSLAVRVTARVPGRLEISGVGLTIAAMAIPPITAMPWHIAAPCLAAGAGLVVFGAIMTGRLLLLIPASLLTADAIGLSLGGPGTTAVTATILTVAAAGMYLLAERHHRFTLAGVLAGFATWTGTGAVLVGLYLLGTPQPLIASSGLVLAAAILMLPAMWWWGRSRTGRPETGAQAIVLGGLAGIAFTVVTAEVVAIDLLATGKLHIALLIPVIVLFVALIGVCDAVATARPAGSGHRAPTAATVALLTALGGVGVVLAPEYGLMIHTGLALLTGLIVRFLPLRYTRATGSAAVVVGGACALIAGLLAAYAIPIMLGLREVGHTAGLNWQTPIILLAIATGIALAPAKPPRADLAVSAAGLAIIAAPAVWPLPWWAAGVTALLAGTAMASWAAITKLDSSATFRFALAGGLLVYAPATAALSPLQADASARFAVAAALSAGIVAGCAATAFLARRSRTGFGGIAVAAAITVMPVAAQFAGVAAAWPATTIHLALMGATTIGLLTAALLRAAGSRYLLWASATVPPVGTICALTTLDEPAAPLYLAVAGLIGIGAAMLNLPSRRPMVIRAVLSIPTLLITVVLAGPLTLAAIARPYGWLTAVWSRLPTGTVDGLSPVPQAWPEGAWQLAALAVVTVTLVLGVLGLAGPRWALGVAVAGVAASTPTVPVVLDLPWPSLPVTALIMAIAGYTIVSYARLTTAQRICPALLTAVVGGSAVSGALAARPTTLAALGAVCLVAIAVAFSGNTAGGRIFAWLLTTGSGVALAVAAGFAAELAAGQTAFGIVAVSMVLLTIGAIGRPADRGTRWAAELGGHLAMGAAVVAALPSRPHTAAVLLIGGAVLGLLALRVSLVPDANDNRTRWYGFVAAGMAVVAYWLLLGEAAISTIEWYTIPFAALTVFAGWLELRRRPRLHSWLAFGPGLLLGTAPTAAAIIVDPDTSWRRAALGLAALAILLLGSMRRLQAPVVLGGGLLLALAGHELILLWNHVPFWAPLAAAGALLLILGASFEKRRRDFKRLRQAIGGMR